MSKDFEEEFDDNVDIKNILTYKSIDFNQITINDVIHQLQSILLNDHEIIWQREKKHIEIRSSSFERLRILEECYRYRQNEQKIENEQAEALTTELLNEYKLNKYQSNYSQCLINLIEKFVEECLNKKSKEFTMFPWITYDESIQSNCTMLLSNDQLQECSSYLLGYIECITRVSSHMYTQQGKLTDESAGWAIKRHPFGRYISIFRITLMYLYEQLLLEKITKEFICKVIDDFINISEQGWAILWSKCYNLNNQIKNMFIENIQHAMFMLCPYLPYLLFHEPIIITNKPFFNHNQLIYISNLPNDISKHKCLYIKLVNYLSITDLFGLISIPMKFQLIQAHAIDNSNVDQYSILLSNNDSAGNIELNAWNSIKNSPYTIVGRDIHLLHFAKTPLEVASVLVNVLQTLNGISNEIVTGIKFVHKPMSGIVKVNESVANKSIKQNTNSNYELSADELIPLLTFSFSLYFRTPINNIESVNSNICNYYDPNIIIAKIKFADKYLPSHYHASEEGYAIAVCLSALLTLPI